jgi:anionic cell wall polymer biosynthesis LytR-Cps2A-Psr (LCP) family protein
VRRGVLLARGLAAVVSLLVLAGSGYGWFAYRTLGDSLTHVAGLRISLLGFYQVAQVLGPVQVCLNEAVDDPYSGTDLPAGVSTLDAKQALSFVRQRHGLPRGDLDREVRQQYFLAAELRKVTSSGVLLNPGKLHALLQAAGSAVQTDPDLDLLSYTSQFASLGAGDVRFTTIPVLGTPTITDGDGNPVSVVEVDTTALPAFIAGIVGEPSAYSSAPAATPSSVRVSVVNGTGTTGWPRRRRRRSVRWASPQRSTPRPSRRR